MAVKKRALVNWPQSGMRGHYTFDNPDALHRHESTGIQASASKFSRKDLYTNVDTNKVNDAIINFKLKHKMGTPNVSYIRIDKFKVVNAGVKHMISSPTVQAWIADNYVFSGDPRRMTVEDIEARLSALSDDDEYRPKQFMTWAHVLLKKGKGPGTVLQKQNIFEGLGATPPAEPSFNPSTGISPTQVPSGKPAFQPEEPANQVQESGYEEEGAPTIFDSRMYNYGNPQTIYIIVRTSGDAMRWFGRDRRKRRIQIFTIPVKELFDTNPSGAQHGIGKVSEWKFGSSDSFNLETGGGTTIRNWLGEILHVYPESLGAETPAFKCSELNLTINTMSDIQEEESLNLTNTVNKMTSSIQAGTTMNTDAPNQFDESFMSQYPNQEILNVTYDEENWGWLSDNPAKSDFEPVTNISIKGVSELDLQEYQNTVKKQQMASAPAEVELNIDLVRKDVIDYDLVPGSMFTTSTPEKGLEYMYYVVDWDDSENKFRDSEDFMDDRPTEMYDLFEKRRENLYNFARVGVPLTHTYTTPGFKTIKAVVFSYTTVGYKQIIRWKFVTSKFYLDVPLNLYPDFNEFGGGKFTTLPWPTTTPVIGGINRDSKYMISVENVLKSKIDNSDTIDEKFLNQSYYNEELGKSIGKVDVEQVRYFSTGSYDLDSLLGMEAFDFQISSSWDMSECPYEFGAPCSSIPYAGGQNVMYCNENCGCNGFVIGEDVGEPIIAGYFGWDSDQLDAWAMDSCTVFNTDSGNVSTVQENFGTVLEICTFLYGGNLSDYNIVQCDQQPVSTLPVFSYASPISYMCVDTSNYEEGMPFCSGNSISGIYNEDNVFDNVKRWNHLDENGNWYWDCRDWDGERNHCFSNETSVGQIFIDDNVDQQIQSDCAVELNTGEIDYRFSTRDTSGMGSKGILIGDYKLNKRGKGKDKPLRKEMKIKTPERHKKGGGAL